MARLCHCSMAYQKLFRKQTNCWANMSYRIIQARRNMNNFLTFHAEATPDGVNIMYRSNDGMTERVE
ncbi:TPA: hypothetical protein ACHFN9_005749, partial [Escherichia coli]